MLDRFGPRICNIVGCLCLVIGSLLMYFAFRITEFDGYVLGNFFLSLGGTCIFVPAFQIANAFPKKSGVIVALVTGAFDASAAVFLFYRIAYEATNRAIRPEYFFLGYLTVPIAIFLAQIFLLPSKPYKTVFQLEEKIEAARDPTQDIHDSDEEISDDNEVASIRAARRKKRQNKLKKIDTVLGGLDERQQREEQEEERHAAARVWGVLHGEPVHYRAYGQSIRAASSFAPSSISRLRFRCLYLPSSSPIQLTVFSCALTISSSSARWSWVAAIEGVRCSDGAPLQRLSGTQPAKRVRASAAAARRGRVQTASGATLSS